MENKRVADYIPEADKKYYCEECYDICGLYCVIYRKAYIEQLKWITANSEKKVEDVK